MKKIILIAVAVLVVVSAALFLKKQKENVANLPTAKEYLKSVDVVTPKEEYLSEKKEFLAEVLSSKSAYIATKFVARIKKIYVNENDKVKKGGLLVSLDDQDIVATLSSLKEQKKALAFDVANAKNTLQRNKKLYAIAAISKEAFDTSKAMYQTKLSALKTTDEKIVQTKVQLQYLNIKAPFSGVIGSKLLDAGSLAPAGKAIVTLNSDDQKLNFLFSQNDKPIISGQKVFLDNKEIGYISKIYDDAKNTLQVAEVKLYKSLPYANKSYKTVEVEVDSAKACTLPLNAILHKREGTYVMVYKDGKFSQHKVSIILQNAHRVAISPCPKGVVATASEAKLSVLPTYGKIILNKAQ
jgi:RND family efflux transporter MFP subunit